MPDSDSREIGRRFARPWEDPDTAEREALDERPAPPPDAPADPGVPATESGDDPELPESDDRHRYDDLADVPSGFEHFSGDDYVANTTSEYQGLAEDVARADTEQYQRQAVAASPAGVGSGLIGFEDVTGRKGISEEDVEREEQQRTSDLAVRVGSAVVLVGLFLACLLLGGILFTAFVSVTMVVALGELYATVRSRGYAPPAIFGFLGLLGLSIGAHRSGPWAIAGWLLATIVALGFFYAVANRRNPLENASVTVFGLAWIALLGFAIVIGRSENAAALILLIVLVTGLFDVGSYFVGRAFGIRPLAPRVSPKKTIEGLVGGVMMAFAVSAALSTIPLFDPLDLRASLAFAGLVSIFAPLGDAAESVVKRALDVKDMGSILPGHGGMLDRIDSLLFVVPAAYFFFRALGYL